jgi:hypothetical protein
MPKRKDNTNLARRPDTGDYSATKAPENRPHVESKVAAAPAQRPGGPLGTPSDVGMSGLDRHTVPKMAAEDLASEDNGEANAQRAAFEADYTGVSTWGLPSRRG